jgi:hypothetical protein
MRPEEAAGLDQAVILGQARHAGPGRGKKTGDIITRFSRGTEAAYLRAKLKRDGLTGELAALIAARLPCMP